MSLVLPETLHFVHFSAKLFRHFINKIPQRASYLTSTIIFNRYSVIILWYTYMYLQMLTFISYSSLQNCGIQVMRNKTFTALVHVDLLYLNYNNFTRPIHRNPFKFFSVGVLWVYFYFNFLSHPKFDCFQFDPCCNY